MTILKKELKASLISLIIWSVALSFMLGVCIIIYPEMSKQMGEISEMFADMRAFSSAFGMDSLNFGEFMGYFGIECGNTLGLGGAIFAAIPIEADESAPALQGVRRRRGSPSQRARGMTVCRR